MTPGGARPIVVGAVASPLGELCLAVDEAGLLHAADFAGCEARLRRMLDRGLGRGRWTASSGDVASGLRRCLDDYFAGDVAAITRVALAVAGSPFQATVWAALRALPAGTAMSYGALAARIGRPGAARAVGAANAANPWCIIVPCHRLTAADGALTGYSGGLARKRWLLQHEARHAAPQSRG